MSSQIFYSPQPMFYARKQLFFLTLGLIVLSKHGKAEALQSASCPYLWLFDARYRATFEQEGGPGPEPSIILTFKSCSGGCFGGAESGKKCLGCTPLLHQALNLWGRDLIPFWQYRLQSLQSANTAPESLRAEILDTKHSMKPTTTLSKQSIGRFSFPQSFPPTLPSTYL